MWTWRRIGAHSAIFVEIHSIHQTKHKKNIKRSHNNKRKKRNDETQNELDGNNLEKRDKRLRQKRIIQFSKSQHLLMCLNDLLLFGDVIIYIFFFSSRWKFRNRKPVVDLLDAQKYFSNRKVLFEFLFKRKGFTFFCTQCILFKPNIFFQLRFPATEKKTQLFIHALYGVCCVCVCVFGECLVWAVCIVVLVDEFLERFSILVFECDTIWVLHSIDIKAKRT